MRALTLLGAALLACEGAPPTIVQVEPPGDSRNPIGPYQVAAVVRGVTTRVEVRWALEPGVESAGVSLEMARAGDRWFGGVPGAPPGAQVWLYVEASGPGGVVRSPRGAPYTFKIHDPSGVCLVDGDCLGGEICDRARLRCKVPPAACRDDADCPQDYVCPGEGGRCRFRPSVCEADAACGPGLVCDAALCVSRSQCQGQEDCPAGTRCVIPPGRCAASSDCARDADCPLIQPLCLAGRCVERGDDVCGGCPPAQRCSPTLTRCVQCFADGHCGPGEHCELARGTCQEGRRGSLCEPCSGHGQCGAGQICDLGFTGACMKACDDGQGCSDAGFACDGMICRPLEGICVGVACRRDEACPSGACLGGVCDPEQPCRQPGDCGEGRRCAEDRCVPEHPSCRVAGDCEAGLVCFLGRCVPNEPRRACERCTQSDECGPAALCARLDESDQRRCLVACGSAGCPDPFVCVDVMVDEGVAICTHRTGRCDPDEGPPDCADENEPNDALDQATPLQGQVDAFGLLCTGDRDWFALLAGGDGQVVVQLLGPDPLRYRLLTGDGAVVDQGEAPDWLELPVWREPAGLFLELSCEGTCRAEYAVWGEWEIGACPEDQYEPNDDPESAAAVALPVEARELFVCGGRDDWYAFEAPGDGRDIIIRADFDHDLGDLDISLQDVDGLVIRESASVRDRERIRARLRAGLYLLRVYLCCDDLGPQPYQLTIRREAE